MLICLIPKALCLKQTTESLSNVVGIVELHRQIDNMLDRLLADGGLDHLQRCSLDEIALGLIAVQPKLQAFRSYERRAQMAAESAPMFARRPDAALANRSLAHVEPVSCTRKRKLENGEQRLGRQNRLFRPETLEIAGQRLRRATLNPRKCRRFSQTRK
jgi:hypothetical protein